MTRTETPRRWASRIASASRSSVIVKTQTSAVRRARAPAAPGWARGQSSPGAEMGLGPGLMDRGPPAVPDRLEDVFQPGEHPAIVRIREGGAGDREGLAADGVRVGLRPRAGEESGQGLPLVPRETPVVEGAGEPGGDLGRRHAACLVRGAGAGAGRLSPDRTRQYPHRAPASSGSRRDRRVIFLAGRQGHLPVALPPETGAPRSDAARRRWFAPGSPGAAPSGLTF